MTNPLLANWRAKGVVCEETADTRLIVSEVGDRAANRLNYVPNFVFLPLSETRVFSDSVGSAEPCRNLLAASPCIVSGCVPFRHGHWLPRQLG